MDKVLKISLVFGIVLVSLSVAYYLVVFLPQRESRIAEAQKNEQLAKDAQKDEALQKELSAKIAKCAEDAKKFHNEYINSIKGFYFEPKYGYNKDLNKCLYSGGYGEKKLSVEDFKSGEKSYWERFVKDVYTNETVLSAWSGFESKQSDEFWKQHKELFEQ